MPTVGLLVAILAVIWVCRRVRHPVIAEWEQALVFRHGRFQCLLPPGAHWLLGGGLRVPPVDLRVRILTVPGQDVLTADQVSLKISLAVQYRVVDPLAAVTTVEDYREALRLVAQLALRHVIGALTIDQVSTQRAEIAVLMKAHAADAVMALGLSVTTLDVKDIMPPGDLKRVFAQVVTAQQEGRALLERARGETAALRCLANGAGLLARHPGLLQLRTLQAIEASSGNTIVLNAGSGDSCAVSAQAVDEDPNAPARP